MLILNQGGESPYKNDIFHTEERLNTSLVTES